MLASGEDAGGRGLPSNAWMALRRLGWSCGPPEGVRVNDRIVRMAQEQAGRVLRSVKWRADLTVGVLTTWPADPAKRHAGEWDAVRNAVTGGASLPSSVIKSRTRQAASFVRRHGRLPVDVFELEAAPRTARMLLLSACDGQRATIERHESDPGRALLRLQLPTRPDPRSYGDWTWVSCPVSLPPTVPAGAVLHLPTLRIHQGRVRADLAYTHAVPKSRRIGHTVALGVDWGLNTMLSAGAVRLHDDGTITPLGAGACSGPAASWRNSIACAVCPSACTPNPIGTSGSPAATPGTHWRPGTGSSPMRSDTSATAGRTSTTPWPGRRHVGPWTRPSPPGRA
ncbi:hypothetical protein OG352_19230 [Streptomyces sp. NBC_01485]|uniref:hypothetical protein n=1 Tax=Streptomyces sp. NBC_01485 TaxID=2903884 RepID=UPI002E2FD9F3|nr:hypothetical protein [Streptomyces sp. NBC_01485]